MPLRSVESLAFEDDLNEDQQDNSVEGQIAQIQQSGELPAELIGALESIYDRLQTNDQPFRYMTLLTGKRNEAYWRGISKILFTADTKDWVTLTSVKEEDNEYSDIRDTTINIYKPYGETVVSAITSAEIQLTWSPEDADNPSDLQSSKAFPKLLRKLQYDNGDKGFTLARIRIAYLLWNQSLVAIYNHYEEDAKYGTVSNAIFKPVQEKIIEAACPNCGGIIGDESISTEQMILCPQCGSPIIPVLQERVEEYEEVDHFEDVPKGVEKIEVWGSLNVSVPHNINDFSKAPYLSFEHEEHLYWVREKYPHMYSKVKEGATTSSRDTYGRWARTPLENAGALSPDIITVREVWFRPCAYNFLTEDSEERELLKKLFPEGTKAVWLNDDFAGASNEDVDKHWTISVDPTSHYIHTDPRGNGMVPIQDMRSEAIDLTLETMEQAIPETFYDSDLIDADKYAQGQKKPGTLVPVKMKGDVSLSNRVMQLHSASLSAEVPNFVERLTRDGEFESGAPPSLWGGPGQGSKTLGEYQESRSVAMQRHAIPWKIMVDLYERAMPKACLEYKENMLEDEKYAEKTGDGWINIWIKREELEGKTGRVYCENSEQIPLTFDQKVTRLFMLLDKNNEILNGIIFHPDNLDVMSKAFGFDGLFVPGQNDRNKQLLMIIKMLTLGQPIPPEQLVDDSAICLEVSKAWANSDIGQFHKENNPNGYNAVMMNMQMHNQILMIAQQQAAQNEMALEQTSESE